MGVRRTQFHKEFNSQGDRIMKKLQQIGNRIMKKLRQIKDISSEIFLAIMHPAKNYENAGYSKYRHKETLTQ